MSESEDSELFPILDRSTPVLSRVRNMRGKGGSGAGAGRAFAGALMADDEEEKTEIASEFGESMRKTMARELGVNEQDIRTDLPAEFQQIILNVRPEDILTAQSLEEQGIGTTPEPDESEEPSDSLDSDEEDEDESDESEDDPEF